MSERRADRCCVLHAFAPAVEVCIIGQPGVVRDFCAACIENGEDDDNFGRCYECADGLHERCIGVPCQCECPPTALEALDAEIAATEAVLARLRRRKMTLT